MVEDEGGSSEEERGSGKEGQIKIKRERRGREGGREGGREKEPSTYSFILCCAGLCEFYSVYISPGTLCTQHLTVDQSNQVLTHLTLKDTR